MVVQLGLAMMPRGRCSASVALHSGTTRGTSFSITEGTGIVNHHRAIFGDVFGKFDGRATACASEGDVDVFEIVGVVAKFAHHNLLSAKFVGLSRAAFRPKESESSIGKSRSANVRKILGLRHHWRPLWLHSLLAKTVKKKRRSKSLWRNLTMRYSRFYEAKSSIL